MDWFIHPTKGAVVNSGVFKDMVNGDLFFENLILDFHFYHRYFSHGRFFNTVYAMNSIYRTKRQENVVFPRLSAVDTKKLLKTNLGEGEIEKLELSTDTDFYKATIRFKYSDGGTIG